MARLAPPAAGRAGQLASAWRSGGCGATRNAQFQRALQAEIPLALDQADDHAGIDAVVFLEDHVAGLRADVEPADAGCAAALREPRDVEQVLRGCGQLAEAVDDLGAQFIQFGGIGRGRRCACTAPGASARPRRSRRAAVPVRAGPLRWRRRAASARRILACLQRAHGGIQHVQVHRQAHLGELAALRLAEQFAGAADLQVVRGEHEARAQLLQRFDAPRVGAAASWVSALRGGTIR